MRINHNISSINTNRLLVGNNSATSKNLEKLSSGLSINRAGDNAAGLAISEKMRGQIRGLNQASDNANDGISLIQTAEGGLNETHSILQRMRELAVQSANDTNTDSDRKEIQKEVDQLATEITRISTDTEFNTKKLLNGDLAASVDSVTGSNVAGVTVAAGANLTVSGNYTITVSNFSAGTNHPASTGSATMTTQTTADTKANAAAVTYEYKADGWYVEGGAKVGAGDAAALLADSGVTVSGVPQVGDKLTLSQHEAAVTAGATGTCTSGDGTYTYSAASGKWMNGGTEMAGITVTGTIADGATITVASNAVTGTTGLSNTPEVHSAATYTGVAAVTNGTDTTYDLAITDPSGNAVSKSAFNLTGVSGNGAVTVAVSANDALTFHIGANSGQNTKLTVQDMSAAALGVDAVDLTSQASSDAAITTIDTAINTVSAQRAALGAMQNRLEHTINNLGTSSENLSAAESQIRDVDMAEEMSNFTKNNILVQAATSMLAQANQQPQSVLSLLQG